MNVAKQTAPSSVVLFQDWFDRWIDVLWGFIHYQSVSSDEYEDEILYVLNLSRSRIARVYNSNDKGDLATAEFLRNWFSKMKKPKPHPSLRTFDLTWDAQFLIFSLLKMKWPYEKVAILMNLPISTLKYRFFSALCRMAKIDEVDLRSGGRECVRCDLYFVDILLGSHWRDPLKLVDQQELEHHGSSCARCSQLQERLRIKVDEIRRHKVYKAPSEFLASVHEEMGTRWQLLLSGEWFASWPIFLKLPIQVGLAAIVIWAVLSTTVIRNSGSNPAKKAVTVGTQMVSKAESTWENSRIWVEAQWTKLREFVSHHEEAKPQVPVQESKLSAYSSVHPLVSLKQFLPRVDSPIVKIADKTPVKVAVAPLKALDKPIVEAKVAQKTSDKDGKTPTLSSNPEVVPSTPAAAESHASVVEKAVQTETAGTAGTVGDRHFLRWGGFSDDLDADSLKINTILKKYQANRAGELEFGAMYRGGRYFHFSIPKKEYEALLKEIKNLKILEFSVNKAVSDRVTPPDQSRVVFLLLPSKEP